MKQILFLAAAIVFCSSCKELEARKPISRSSGNNIEESIARNKELIAQEEKDIRAYIQRDTLHSYTASSDGFWYSFIKKNRTDSQQTAQVGDLAQITYNLSTLSGRNLLSKSDVGQVITQIDQSNQDLISGIRDALKIMKEGETALFLFPSHKGYGYSGLEEKIPSNTALVCELTLLQLKQQ